MEFRSRPALTLGLFALLLVSRFGYAGKAVNPFAIKKIKYTNPKWNFSVLTFPVVGELVEEPINEPGMTGFRAYSRLAPDVAYAVTVFDVPPTELATTKTDRAFDDYIARLKRRGSQIISTSTTTLDGHPGGNTSLDVPAKAT